MELVLQFLVGANFMVDIIKTKLVPFHFQAMEPATLYLLTYILYKYATCKKVNVWFPSCSSSVTVYVMIWFLNKVRLEIQFFNTKNGCTKWQLWMWIRASWSRLSTPLRLFTKNLVIYSIFPFYIGTKGGRRCNAMRLKLLTKVFVTRN